MVVLFDGLGSSVDDYDFLDNFATLHTQAGLVDIFEDDFDQVAIYTEPYHFFMPIIVSGNESTVSEEDKVRSTSFSVIHGDIHSFVAWGAAPMEDAFNAENEGLWNSSWYVSLFSTGINNEMISEGISIGLLPDSQKGYFDNWEVYQQNEITYGYENLVPVISWFDPQDGAVADGSTFAVSWNVINHASSYHFQLDNNQDFSSPLVDEYLDNPMYISFAPLANDLYYWRVKVIYSSMEGDWSTTRSVETIDLSAYESETTSRSIVKKLEINHQLQHKDTQMLCLDRDSEEGSNPWDNEHVNIGEHGKKYCAHATLSMMASYYGSNISQDRIAYEYFKVDSPEGDLGHGQGVSVGEYDHIIDWFLGVDLELVESKPSFEQIILWIDNQQPIYSIISNGDEDNLAYHARLIVGYTNLIDVGIAELRWIKVLDPGDRFKNIFYLNDNTIAYLVGPSSPNGAPNVRMEEDDEFTTMDDSDSDGIVDFDEVYRFGTDPNKHDSDGDGVGDKQDIREYVFDVNGNYDYRSPYFGDNDVDRKELDWDHDNDGSSDGCEDFNFNGKFEPDLGETNNFDPGDKRDCPSPSNLLPEGFIGSWSGSGIQTNPSKEWTVLMTLNPGSEGSIIGSIAYPSLRCGGTLELINNDEDEIFLFENITYDGSNCINGGTHTMTITLEGLLNFYWEKDGTETTAIGTMNKISSTGTQIPQNFVGTWEGMGYSTSGSEWSILVSLNTGNPYSIVGTIAYPSLKCGGVLSLVNLNSNSIQLFEDITYGTSSCVDEGTVILSTSISSAALDFYYEKEGHPYTATGTVYLISE